MKTLLLSKAIISSTDSVHFGIILWYGKHCFDQFIRSELGTLFRIDVLTIFDGLINYCQTIDTNFIGYVCHSIDSCHHKGNFFHLSLTLT